MLRRESVNKPLRISSEDRIPRRGDRVGPKKKIVIRSRSTNWKNSHQYRLIFCLHIIFASNYQKHNLLTNPSSFHWKLVLFLICSYLVFLCMKHNHFCNLDETYSHWNKRESIKHKEKYEGNLVWRSETVREGPLLFYTCAWTVCGERFGGRIDSYPNA